MEVLVVASLGAGSRLCAALRQRRIAARLFESSVEVPGSATPGGVVLLHLAGPPAAPTVRRLLHERPDLRVVVLGPAEPAHDLLEALLAGAAGYLPEDIEVDALARSVTGVLEGEIALPRAWVGRVVAALRVATGAAAPSPLPSA